MRAFLHIMVLSIVVAISSCTKTSETKDSRLIHSISLAGSSCTIYCTYDTRNRITTVTQCDTLETYTYGNDTIKYVRTSAGTIQYTILYLLDGAGIANSALRVNADNTTNRYTYLYSPDKIRSKWIDETHKDTYKEYTIANGNNITEVCKSSLVAEGNYSINILYYKDTENTLGNENVGKTFLGKSSANLRKTESYDTPDGQFTISYTYELDYRNGVSKRTTTTNGLVTETRYYEYY